MTPTKAKLSGATFRDNAAVLLQQLDARSRDIIARRYGLSSGKGETLDSIGKEYGITRERVRQIEAQVKKLLARRDDVLTPVADVLSDLFAKHGGILTPDYLMDVTVATLAGAPHYPLIRFYLDVLPAYVYVSRSSIFHPHWRQPELILDHAERVVQAAEAVLHQCGVPVPVTDFEVRVRREATVTERDVSAAALSSLLRAGKRLKKTVFGEWGLVGWTETSPRGVSDKAYIVLKRQGKPMHFREITAAINDVRFDHKRAHEQTVHNELIKDDRFVLVGRGLYGLTDWGYIPGTVADVLEAVLAQAREPMTREELLERVLEQRLVKKTTVLLGLQNSARFKRMGDNRYALRRAR